VIHTCELVTEFAFETLIRPHGLTQKEREELLPRSYDLNNKRVNALYMVLSNDKIKTRSFWAGYTTHANLRHAIVHRGERATAQQAQVIPTCRHCPDQTRRGCHRRRP